MTPQHHAPCRLTLSMMLHKNHFFEAKMLIVYRQMRNWLKILRYHPTLCIARSSGAKLLHHHLIFVSPMLWARRHLRWLTQDIIQDGHDARKVANGFMPPQIKWKMATGIHETTNSSDVTGTVHRHRIMLPNHLSKVLYEEWNYNYIIISIYIYIRKSVLSSSWIKRVCGI